MYVWLLQDGEPIPKIDRGARDWRCSMLAKALIEKGHEVFWWATKFDHATKTNRNGFPPIVNVMPGLRVRLLEGPGYTKNRSPQRFRHHRLVAQAFTREIVTAKKPDLIFASLPTPELAEQAVKYATRNHLPVLVDVRDLWPDHYLTLVPKALRGVFQAALLAEYRRVRGLLAGATGITSISQTFLNWGLKMAGTHLRESDHVFPMSYPETNFDQKEVEAKRRELSARYEIQDDELIVVFAGSFGSIFDFSGVLSTARELSRRNEKIRFVLAGDGTDYAIVRAQAAGLGNVVFTGRVDHLSVTALMSLACVGLAPYAEGRSITGSLPNKAFEYMSAGLLLLSSHEGDLANLINEEHIGLQYDARDSLSLFDKVNWLIHHRQETLAMGRRARELFEDRFSRQSVYGNFAAHVERVAAAYKNGK